MPSCIRLVRVIYLGVLVAHANAVFGQKAPTLRLANVGTNGQIGLITQGEAGTNYTLEASVDLKSWWNAGSGVATNGQLAFTYTPATDTAPRFFRARVDVPLPPLSVGVRPDTNFFTLAAVGPGVGAVLSLYDVNLVHYRLTIPTNATDTPVVVQMTVVTNLDNLPFAAGLVGAVALSPAEQMLLAPATLEIEFPTNLVADPSLVAGFAFEADGSYLRLTPGLPVTNSISLQFSTLGGFGCSVATLAEIAQLGQRAAGPVIGLPTEAALSPSPVGRHLEGVYSATGLDQCYPEKLARAKLIDRYLLWKLSTLGAELTAQAITAKRNNRNVGVYPQDWGSQGLHWTGNEDYIYSDFYIQEIQPYLAEAASNCALTEVLDFRIRELVQLADSWGGSATATLGSRLTLCDGYHECLQELMSCCNTHGLGGQATILNAQAFADKAAAIGCTISSSEMDTVAKACLPTWSGSIIILNEVSNYSATVTFDLSSESKEAEEALIVLHTDSAGLSGNSSGNGFYGLTGNLQGNASIRYTFDFHAVDKTCCAGCTTDEHLQGGSTARGTASAAFTFMLTNSPTPPFPVPLWNSVTPNSDLVLSSQCPWAGTEVLQSSGLVTPPGGTEGVCTSFKPVVQPYSGNSYFANLLPYLVSDTGVLGTVVQYHGEYTTNTVSTNGLTVTTKTVSAAWNFKHNN